MCQIFAGPAKNIRTRLLGDDDLLEDLYTSNPDGLGAMYATTKQKLRTPKIVPASVAEARAFIRTLPDDERNLVLHFRWKTSGLVDNDNAHPFIVLPNKLAMTHNGVLHTSTVSDQSKCDTRHYIEQVLRPQLEVHEDLPAINAWLEMMGSDIGSSNRFVFLDQRGEMYFVNRHTGKDLGDFWIANTYSFDASLLIPGFAKPRPKTKVVDYGGYYGLPGSNPWPSQGSYMNGTDDFQDDLNAYRSALGEGVDDPFLPPTGDGATEESQDDDVHTTLWDAIDNVDPEAVAELLDSAPLLTLNTLFQESVFSSALGEEELGANDLSIVKLLVDQDATELFMRASVSYSRARQIAEVICWYGSWYGKPIDERNGALIVPPIKKVAMLPSPVVVTHPQKSIVTRVTVTEQANGVSHPNLTVHQGGNVDLKPTGSIVATHH